VGVDGNCVVIGYFVAIGGNLLRVILWRVVGICCGLLLGDWWEFVKGYCVAICRNLLRVVVWRYVGIC
jgi:hypothetical protein